MDYTFAIDTEQLDTLVSALRDTYATSMETEISSTFNELGSFDENTWSGDSYNDFKDGCKAYEPALKTLPEVIECFAETLEKASINGQDLVSKVESEIDSIG